MKLQYSPERIREARIQRRWTQTELARRAGLSVMAVHKIENGKGPWLKAIHEIELVLGITDVIKTRQTA